jgi:hypothetical protein
MLHATSQSMDPRGIYKILEDNELVAKVYWAEVLRTGEAEIIEKALQIAQQNDDVKGHLPDLICSHDFDEYSTKVIRKAFGFETKGSCYFVDGAHHRLDWRTILEGFLGLLSL